LFEACKKRKIESKIDDWDGRDGCGWWKKKSVGPGRSESLYLMAASCQGRFLRPLCIGLEAVEVDRWRFHCSELWKLELHGIWYPTLGLSPPLVAFS
jgi:hypothetical protein